MLQNRKAQAATELVVLGSLIILAFSYLINYSEKLNRQQANLQQTFRAALKEARGANNSASYTKLAFRRMASVSSPMELGQLQSFSSSANVFWGNGLNEDDGVYKYQLNEGAAIDTPPQKYPADPAAAGDTSGDTEKELESASTTPPAGTVETSNNTFTNRTVSDVTFTKRGNVTNKTLSATDILQADVTASGSEYSFTQSLGAGGKYYPGTGNKLNRSRSMQ